MSFVIYDIIFLVLFTLATVIFLYSRRKNLKREGLLYLYRTQVGVKFIETTNKKCSKFLKSLQYVVIACGYALMIGIIWLIVRFAWFYLTSPTAAKALRIPVVMPLIPYLPDIFKVSYLPPFYFTYWIIIIAIIAIPHEFAHGIFARLNKIRILSTGFGFLGPFLAAFVEQDDKQMQKASKFSQLVVLAAGTFANIIVGLIFVLVLAGFFALAFSPAGVMFNTYSFSPVNTSAITSLDSITIQNMSLIKINAENKSYFTSVDVLNQSITNNIGYVIAYDDAPAFKEQLSGVITDINGKKITSYQEFNKTLLSYNPGDNVTIKTLDNNVVRTYDIILGEKNGKAYLGVGAYVPQRTGLSGFVYSVVSLVKDPLVYYNSNMGDLGIFILDLLWWIVLVSLSVALMNMLPAGIFDGGRFFYLTIWGITRKEKIAKTAFAISTWVLIILVVLMLLKWAYAMSF